jgi:arylsulfatase A-like enzyme
MDLLPTLCEIAGAQITEPIDGQSLADVWLRGGSGDPQRTCVWVRREGNPRYQGRAYYAIRKGSWKLQQSSPFESMVLVNLEHDPYERDPQTADHEVAKGLRKELMLHLQRAGAVPWQQ